jgi:hypothetical protein
VRDAVVRIQAQDGSWEHIGGDRATGIVAERLQLSANAYGPDTATFELRRDPSASWPDLTAFTPVEIEVRNQVCWTGRIAETQLRDGTERSLSVTCEGTQAVLDDDQYSRTYVHRKLSDWQPLSDFVTLSGDWTGHEGIGQSSAGNVQMLWPEGSKPQANQLIGMVLDTGGSGISTGYSLYAHFTRFTEVARKALATGNSGFLSTFGPSATSPYYATSAATIPTYSSGSAYSSTAVVELNGQIYYALRAVPAGNSPQYSAFPWENRKTYAVGNIVWTSPGTFYQLTTALNSFAASLVHPSQSSNWTTYSGYWQPYQPPVGIHIFTASSTAGLQTIAGLTGSYLYNNYSIVHGYGQCRTVSSQPYNNTQKLNSAFLPSTSAFASTYGGSTTTTAFASTGYLDSYAYGAGNVSTSDYPERFIVLVACMRDYAQVALPSQYGYQFDAISVFGDDSLSQYGLANRSIGNVGYWNGTSLKSSLTADTVIKDALISGNTPLTTNVSTAPSLQIPHATTNGMSTPREMIDQANSYHGWITRVNENKELVFKSRPTVPVVQLGKWSGYDFTNQAVTSGQDVYSRVVVDGQSETGGTIRVGRTAAQLASAVQLSTSAGSSLTDDQRALIRVQDRATGYVFNPTNGPAKVNASDKTFVVPGIYRAGVTYVIKGTFVYQNATSSSYPQALTLSVGRDGYCVASGTSTATGTTLSTSGTGTNKVTVYGVNNGVETGPFAVQVLWTPDTDQDWTTGNLLSFNVLNGNFGAGDTTPSCYLGLYSNTDARSRDWSISIRSATLAEMRGIRKTYQLNVPGVQTAATLAAIGDAWLYDHFRAQFKGTVSCSGGQALRQFSTGDAVHPSRMLLQTGELVQLTDRVDPDTGQLGRDARIAAVTYTHDDESVSLELDNRRDNLQTFLNRLANS